MDGATNETISLAPSGNNGSVSYGLDPVGNRLAESSTLPDIPSGTWNFNPDDELSGESYDQNGNVTSTGGKSFTYDSENHLVSMTASGTSASLVYDAFGNRVAKTVNGVTTRYLVEDDVNPTGYPQVFDELTGGSVSRTYTYGLQRIDEDQLISNVWTPSFYGYDGMGSVRNMTSSAGTVTDSYEYDAFGNHRTVEGSTPKNMFYRGEEYDPDLCRLPPVSILRPGELTDPSKKSSPNPAQIHLQQLRRIEICAFPPHRPVQVRSRHAPRRPAQSDQLTLCDVLALVHIDPAQMHGDRVEPQPVVEDHAVALVVELAREHHHAIVAGVHRRSHAGAKIHPLVHACELAVKGPPRPKAVCRRSPHRRAKIPAPQGLRRTLAEDLLLQRNLIFNFLDRLCRRLHELGRNRQHARAVMRRMNLHRARCLLRRAAHLGRSRSSTAARVAHDAELKS
jgi:YD repeat-containing protein